MQPNAVRLLELEREHTGSYLRAAEDWVDIYRRDPKTFATLLAAEQRQITALRRYFRELAVRAQSWVDWSEYNQKVNAAASPVTIDLKYLIDEQGIILQTIFDDKTIQVAAGAQAAQKLYHVDLGLSKASEAVIKAARERSLRLVKDLNDTTISRMQQSLSTSLSINENLRDATERLGNVLNDPIRAERIARTESVDAYNSGVLTFGDKSGAVSKTWQAVDGSACPICSELDGETVDLDEDFSDDVGGAPPGHPNCRCGMRLNYSND